MIREALMPANLFTAASLFCGVAAIMVAAGAEAGDSSAFFQAALLIIFAGIFDGLDGRVARWTNTASDLGVQLDSLVDVVSFGVAPGVLLYRWGLDAYGGAGFVVAFLFILAGVFRLARFNLRANDPQPDAPKKYNEGLPITCAGGMVAVLVLHHSKVRAVEVDNTVSVLLLTLMLSYLMISTVRFRTFREFRLAPSTVALLATVMATAVVTLVVADWTMLLVLVGGSYIAAGLFEEMAFFARRRRADDVFYLDPLAQTEEAEEDEAPVQA
jgi:CDP-diacylglycerol---serine O-phosphatidyltransferase